MWHATRSDIDPRRIGLVGSSQAGWVAATAIRDGARPSDVFLLGAAGTASSVIEQNLYNTRVRMGCAGIAQGDIALALDQQSLFFAARRDRARAPALDALTTRGNAIPALREWLFPDSKGLDEAGWYTVLDPNFDPLPVWKAYRGKRTFLFGAEDDSTDSSACRWQW